MITIQKHYEILACQLVESGSLWQEMARHPLYQTTPMFDSNKVFSRTSIIHIITTFATIRHHGRTKQRVGWETEVGRRP